MADLAREQEDDWQMDEYYYSKERYKNHEMWLDKEGEFLELNEMKDSHMQNCIPFIKKRIAYQEKWIDVFEKELKRRGK